MAKASNNAEKSAFLRNLNARKAELAEAAKKEASSAFLTDEEIINNLGLSDTKKQFKARVSRVRYGLDKHKSPYFAFNFTISEGEHKGTTVSQFFGLGGKTKEERLKKDARVTATFQRLNIDTTKWPTAKVSELMVETADALTLKKPGATIALYTWGDDPEDPRLGIDILGTYAAKPSKEEEEEAEEEQYEDTEEVEEVEEVEEEADEIDYASYVGYEATLTTEDGEITVAATEYDEDTGVFTVEDDNGDVYEVSFEDLDFGE